MKSSIVAVLSVFGVLLFSQPQAQALNDVSSGVCASTPGMKESDALLTKLATKAKRVLSIDMMQRVSNKLDTVTSEVKDCKELVQKTTAFFTAIDATLEQLENQVK